MTTFLVPETHSVTGEPSLFDSLSRLVPPELQREYYRVLAHTRSLSSDDEMLKILEAMGILALVTRQTPGDIADERERIKEMLDLHLQFAGEAQRRMLGYTIQLENRLAALPSEVRDGINPEKVSKLLGETLRQHFVQTGIEDTANALQQTATSLATAQRRLAATFVDITDSRQGIIARIEASNKQLDKLLQSRLKQLDNLLHEFKSDILKVWIPLVTCAAFLLGFFTNASLERYRDTLPDPTSTVQSQSVQHAAPNSVSEVHTRRSKTN